MADERNPTRNHGLPRPAPGAFEGSWPTDVTNDVTAKLEEKLVARDLEANLADYEPYEDAVFVATDTGAVYDGGGTRWKRASRDFESVSVDALVTGSRPVANAQAHGAAGDGSTDDTAAIQAAADEASPDGTVYLPDSPGGYLVSSPVDLGGASIESSGSWSSRLVVDPATGPGDWQYGPLPNDVATVFNRNRDHWTARGVTVEGNDVFTAGIVAAGGRHVKLVANTVVDVANSGVQLYGEMGAGDGPIEDAVVANNTVRGCRWNLVADGRLRNFTMEGNTSRDPTNSHVSIHAGEGAAGEEIRGGSVTGNSCFGRRDPPSGWRDHPSPLREETAIAIRSSDTFVEVSGNYVCGWPGATFSIPRGVEAQIRGNTAHDCDVGVEFTGGQGPMCVVDGLTVVNTDPDAVGVDLGGASTSRSLFVQNCRFQRDVAAFENVPESIPSGWVFADNYDSTGDEVSP